MPVAQSDSWNTSYNWTQVESKRRRPMHDVSYLCVSSLIHPKLLQIALSLDLVRDNDVLGDLPHQLAQKGENPAAPVLSPDPLAQSCWNLY